ncbi:hypothetical protein MCHI_003375 [Candidatus Magnetoovum chiemensis]|nr:hypothetical protein MCHI_003375 [Candidatus Magnetoovum chiemensis]
MLKEEKDVQNAVKKLAGNKDWETIRKWLNKSFIAQSIINNVQRDDTFANGTGQSASAR